MKEADSHLLEWHPVTLHSSSGGLEYRRGHARGEGKEEAAQDVARDLAE